MRYVVIIIVALSLGTSIAGPPSDVVGIYEASVSFSGHDPRFSGQEYVWRLELKADSTFSFSTEIPMAIYLESPPYEMVTKAPSGAAGTWAMEADTVILTRQSGDASVGSSNTLSFSFINKRLKITMIAGKAVISEGEKRLEVKGVPKEE